MFTAFRNSFGLSRNKLVYKSKFLSLRAAGLAESREELDYLLNVRKLIVFAVHELNKPLKYENCATWWANPLDLIYHEEILKSETHVVHLIKFHIQPGDFQLVAKIRQQISRIEIDDDELEIIDAFEIINFDGCNSEVMVVAETCLRPDDENFVVYNAITNELRRRWNDTETELKTWLPDKSFCVSDYINFTDYEWFIKSPGHTTRDMATLHYSTEYCGPDIKMLVMVSSAPSHFGQRTLIRETYAHSSNLEGKGIKVVFLMGVPSNETLDDEVKREADTWKDIIQANFVDSYANLTISHLSMYKWAHLTCTEGRDSGVTIPQFILKADDDFILNLELALLVAQRNSECEFIGCAFCSGTAVRELDHMPKYYTPRYMHISSSYAGYLSGTAYLLRADVIPRLLHMSITTPIIHMDDAYVSGILLRQLSITPKYSPLFGYDRVEPDKDNCQYKRTVASHVDNLEDMTNQWKAIQERMPSNCTTEGLEIKVPPISDYDWKRCFY